MVGVSSAAALFVRHAGLAVAPDPPAPVRAQRMADPPAPAEPAGRPHGDPPAPTAIPFSPRIYPATPVAPAAPTPAPGQPRAPMTGPGGAPGVAGSNAPNGVPHAFPAGTPVPMLLDRLKAAADAGDRDAACRVGLELARCSAGAPMVAAITSGALVMQPQCAGVSPSDVQSASRYLSQASAAGSDAARRALAGDSSVSPSECGR